MNRRLDGQLLTTDDLYEIARTAGVPESILLGFGGLHNTNLIHSALLNITRHARFAMYARSELNLDTRFSTNGKLSHGD